MSKDKPRHLEDYFKCDQKVNYEINPSELEEEENSTVFCHNTVLGSEEYPDAHYLTRKVGEKLSSVKNKLKYNSCYTSECRLKVCGCAIESINADEFVEEYFNKKEKDLDKKKQELDRKRDSIEKSMVGCPTQCTPSNCVCESNDEVVKPFKFGETINKNKATGKKEQEGKLFYELDWDFITQMAERMQSNKDNSKYPRWNWKKPMDVESLKQALFRHVMDVMKGDYEDDQREMGHLEAIATNVMLINYQLKNQE